MWSWAVYSSFIRHVGRPALPFEVLDAYKAAHPGAHAGRKTMGRCDSHEWISLAAVYAESWAYCCSVPAAALAESPLGTLQQEQLCCSCCNEGNDGGPAGSSKELELRVGLVVGHVQLLALPFSGAFAIPDFLAPFDHEDDRISKKCSKILHHHLKKE